MGHGCATVGLGSAIDSMTTSIRFSCAHFPIDCLLIGSASVGLESAIDCRDCSSSSAVSSSSHTSSTSDAAATGSASVGLGVGIDRVGLGVCIDGTSDAAASGGASVGLGDCGDSWGGRPFGLSRGLGVAVDCGDCWDCRAVAVGPGIFSALDSGDCWDCWDCRGGGLSIVLRRGGLRLRLPSLPRASACRGGAAASSVDCSRFAGRHGLRLCRRQLRLHWPSLPLAAACRGGPDPGSAAGFVGAPPQSNL